MLATLAATAVMIGLPTWACGGDDDIDARRGANVQERLAAAAQRGIRAEVADLASFSFDRVLVVSGAADASTIDRRLGFAWRRAEDEGYKGGDPAPLWLFVRDDQVVAWLRPGIEVAYGDCLRRGTYLPATQIDSIRCRNRRGR